MVKKNFWGKLRGLVKTGLVAPTDWRRRKSVSSNRTGGGNLNPKIAKALLMKVKNNRQKQSKDIQETKKLQRFKKLETSKSNYLSSNASSRLKAKLMKAAEIEKVKRDKLRRQRRRSMATGEIMINTMDIQQDRPTSATLNRNIIQINNMHHDESSDEEKDNRMKEMKMKHEEDIGGGALLLEIQQQIDQNGKSRSQSPLQSSVMTKKIDYEKLIIKNGGLNMNNESPPGCGIYRPPAILYGREFMNSFVDNRNKGCLPTFALNCNQMIWVSGFYERYRYKYGFRPLCSSTARESNLYNSNYDIIDVACQSELRTLFVTKSRLGNRSSSVYFVQGESQSMKGGSLNKAEVIEITHISKDIEHVACTSGRMYALSKYGEIYSIAPKPSDDSRYVWESSTGTATGTTAGTCNIEIKTNESGSNSNLRNKNIDDDDDDDDESHNDSRTSEVKDKDGTTNDSFFIRRMPLLNSKRIVSISAGNNHVVCINYDGMVWSWGSGIGLGLGQNVIDAVHPTLITSIQKIRKLKVIQISAGSHHTLALAIRKDNNKDGGKDNDNEFQSEQVGLSWGAWDTRLGSSRRPTTTTLSTCWEPMIMTKLQKLKSFATNENNSTTSTLSVLFQSMHAGGSHSIGLDKFGYIWSFGNNNFGQLGLGHIKPMSTPKQLKLPINVHNVSVGERHTIVVTSVGNVWSFGDNSDGSLGLTGGLSCRIVPRIVMGSIHGTKIKRVISGRKISILISDHLTHDTRGKWCSINNGHRRGEELRNGKYGEKKNMGIIENINKQMNERKNDNNNFKYLTIRENSKKKPKRGWNRIKTFEKQRLKKEKEINEQKELMRLEIRKKKLSDRKNRKMFGESDSSDDDEDKIISLHEKNKKIEKMKKSQLIQLNNYLLDSSFIQPSIIMTRNPMKKWMLRAPLWMIQCNEWHNNINNNKKMYSTNYNVSDRELWLSGKINNDNNISGRSKRVKHYEKLYNIRDSFFKQRQYITKLIRAQARIRGIFVRSNEKKKEELRERKNRRISVEILAKKQKLERIRKARRKSILSLPPKRIIKNEKIKEKPKFVNLLFKMRQKGLVGEKKKDKEE